MFLHQFEDYCSYVRVFGKLKRNSGQKTDISTRKNRVYFLRKFAAAWGSTGISRYFPLMCEFDCLLGGGGISWVTMHPNMNQAYIILFFPLCVYVRKICIVLLLRVKRSGLKDSLGRCSVQQHWLNTSAICSSFFYVGWNTVEVAHISHHAVLNLGVAYYDVSRFFIFFSLPLHLHSHF